MTPSTSCKYLGFIINSRTLHVELPPEKINRIIKEVQKFITIKKCKIRSFAQLVGLLVSACPGIEYGWLYTKELERCKFLNLQGDGNYEKFMSIPRSLHTDLKWWLKSIPYSVKQIRDDNYSLEVFSDASTTGWGAACGKERASGPWSSQERELHINQLELQAAFIALKIFAKFHTHCQILMRIDNSTAICYINRMGGIQFPHLTHIAKDIWQWCEQRKIFLFASYIKSSENKDADIESRRCHPNIEWELKPSSFKTIERSFGTPDIDLFASRINKKCRLYVSWQKDPDAVAVNAFTLKWTSYFFYAFPPFSIILKMLRKIIHDKARGIVVVPMWPSQPWYPIFQQLQVSDVIFFSPNDGVIHSHSSKGRRQPYPGCRCLVREALLRRSVPPSSTDIMLASLSVNSIKQYDVCLKRWHAFCIQNNRDVYEASIPLIIHFLT